ncbi:MAG: hypothetical protein RIT14_346, partial [Pseudomonadota bacterium]
SRCLRMGGESMDEEITNYLKKHHSILVGEGAAEGIKVGIGPALLADGGAALPISVKGRHTVTGMPTEVSVLQSDIVRAILPVIDMLAAAIRDVIEQSPPDIMSDVLENGITLTGGVARLEGIGPAIEERLNLKVTIAEDPDHVVARGLNAVMRDRKSFKHIFVDAD